MGSRLETLIKIPLPCRGELSSQKISIMKISFLLAAMTVILSCTKTDVNSQTTVQSIPPKAFSQKIEASSNEVILDVRTPEEFSEGHLKNAINIDVDNDNFKTEISKLNKSTPVYVYCYAGGRGSTAGKELVKAGFKEVYNMDGGIKEWEEAGLPIIK